MDTSQLRIAVTGGTSGLGLALVREWHRSGARVAFVARTQENVDRIAAELPGTVGIVGDVSVKEQIHPIALQVLGRLGGLDVLVNSASSLGPVALAYPQWGAYGASKAALHHMSAIWSQELAREGVSVLERLRQRARVAVAA